MQYLGLWQKNIHDVRLASRFSVFEPGEDDLVASDLAVLLPLQGWLPGDSDSCGIYGLNLHFPRGCSRHWKSDKDEGQIKRVRQKHRQMEGQWKGREQSKEKETRS